MEPGLSMTSQGTPRGFIAGEGGYSLVMMVLSLQVMIVVGLLAVPKLGTYMQQYRLIGSSGQLEFEINRARMQAVGQNKDVRIKFQGTTPYTQYARQTLVGGTWTTEAGGTINLPIGVTATASPSDGNIQFDHRGMATSNSTITMTNNVQKTKTVTTNVIGRVTVG